ncbi:uncharacterized protein TNCV_3473621 [Trichonephila clavipes]|nr:uncharacterized protein TNCV_3473621 [Trichonephila clavipes]
MVYEGLIASSYECPKCNDRHDVIWSAIKRFLRNHTLPLKTRRVGQRCTLNLSRAETSSRWCGVVVRRGWCQLRCRPRHLTMVQNYVVRRQKPSCS